MGLSARTAAPEAVQVADRFHLWQNLATAVDKCVARHKSCPTGPVNMSISESAPAEAPELTGAMAERRRAHHALVHQLLAQGARLSADRPASGLVVPDGVEVRLRRNLAGAGGWQKPRPSLVDPLK
ncbi:MAG: hypothetical protein SYR96_25170 [Actinomycetota bacterium]|nr:hypothetical protein [Actinomycetota bacterium]